MSEGPTWLIPKNLRIPLSAGEHFWHVFPLPTRFQQKAWEFGTENRVPKDV
jgi:hypothetical protein